MLSVGVEGGSCDVGDEYLGEVGDGGDNVCFGEAFCDDGSGRVMVDEEDGS